METVKLEESFSEHTQKILALAKNEAQKRGTDLIGTEYLLFGLLDLTDEVLSKIMTTLSVNLEDVKEYVKYNLPGSGKPTMANINLSPRAKRGLDLAQEERLQMNHRYIEGEHLLLGILKEGEGMGFQVLKRFGVTYDNARAAIMKVVGKGKESEQAVQVPTPLLDKFGEDFSNRAREGKLDPVIGRNDEIERVLQILSRRRKNNPVLVGEAGVGKTAIVEGMAYRMVTGDIPDVLRGKRIVGLSMMSLMAGASMRGQFEERLQNILKEVKATNGSIILFFDEMHTLISADESSGTANILKPILARGEIQCIGATTTNEYRLYIEKDQALERRFQPIMVNEPSFEDTLDILKGLRDKYEAFHRVIIPDDVLIEAIRLSDRYIFDRYQPDKAIDLIDEAGAATRLPSFAAPKKIQQLEGKIEQLNKELEHAKRNNVKEDVKQLTDKIAEQQQLLQETKEDVQQEKAKTQNTISKSTLREIVAKSTGIPLRHIKESESERLLKMEDFLHQRLVGQNEAVTLVSQAIRRGRAGLKKANKPVGTFLFMGPTGVGKTELAKTLAEYLFGTEEAMIRFDMSEYMEKHAYFRLIGAPPGYVGYEEGGQLTEAVRKKPFSVILFDEIEKAHPDIFNLFLQMFDDGRLTDSKGHVVNFKNTIIICTSNIGSTKIQQKIFDYTQSREAARNTAGTDKKKKTMKKKASLEDIALPPIEPVLKNPDNLPMVVQEKEKELLTINQTKDEKPTEPTNDNSALKKAFMEHLKKEMVEELKEFLRPEMINRFDELIIFEPLTQEDIAKIVDVMLKETMRNLKDQELAMTLSAEAKSLLSTMGYDPVFGARPLKRVIQQSIDTPLSDLIISGKAKPKDTVVCDVKDHQFAFSITHASPTQEEKQPEQKDTAEKKDTTKKNRIEGTESDTTPKK